MDEVVAGLHASIYVLLSPSYSKGKKKNCIERLSRRITTNIEKELFSMPLPLHACVEKRVSLARCWRETLCLDVVSYICVDRNLSLNASDFLREQRLFSRHSCRQQVN